MNNFERNFNRQRSLFNVFFVIALILILLVWAFYGFVVYKGAQVLSDPNSAQSAGRIVGEFMKGIEDGKK